MAVSEQAPGSISATMHSNRGRCLIALAALMWSTSGALTNLLRENTAFHLDSPPVAGLQIAFFRAFFAGLVLLPMVRRRDISFRPMMLVMVGSFAVMNALFVTALAEGTAANAIFLQYTAPLWMYLASIWWLGEAPDRRSSGAVIIGLIGIVVIVWGGGQEAQLPVIAIALGSGLAYAGVILCLRVLREASPRWLVIINHLFSALVLIPLLLVLSPGWPTWEQLGVLFVFGAVQMGLPYWLMAKGLKVVSPQEAGTITLIEPLLNPVWAYLVAPAKELPSVYTLIGGVFILGALAWRYWPRRMAR